MKVDRLETAEEGHSEAESFTSFVSSLSPFICGLYDTNQLSEISAALYPYYICLSYAFPGFADKNVYEGTENTFNKIYAPEYNLFLEAIFTGLLMSL